MTFNVRIENDNHYEKVSLHKKSNSAEFFSFSIFSVFISNTGKCRTERVQPLFMQYVCSTELRYTA